MRAVADIGEPPVGKNQRLQPCFNIAQCIDPPHRLAFHSPGTQRTNGIK